MENEKKAQSFDEKLGINEQDNINYVEIAYDVLNNLKENPNFDVFDYFHITTLTPTELLRKSKVNFSADEVKRIKNVLAIDNISNIFRKAPERLLDINYYLPMKDGAIYEAGQEAKKEVYDYFVRHNFPFSMKAFKTGLYRYAEGTLYEYEDGPRTRK